MAVQDPKLDPKILTSARREFLEKGFLNASLKKICENAEVTTGAVYIRYKGKEDLFEATIQPALNLLKTMLKNHSDINLDRMKNDALSKQFDMSLAIQESMIHHLYSEAEAMKLLFGRAEGTKFGNFLHDFVEENARVSYGFIEEAIRRGLSTTEIAYEEYHIILTSYWTSIFEMFIHDFPLERALEFSKTLVLLFDWKAILKYK